jgi:hypothetical protein
MLLLSPAPRSGSTCTCSIGRLPVCTEYKIRMEFSMSGLHHDIKIRLQPVLKAGILACHVQSPLRVRKDISVLCLLLLFQRVLGASEREAVVGQLTVILLQTLRYRSRCRRAACYRGDVPLPILEMAILYQLPKFASCVAHLYCHRKCRNAHFGFSFVLILEQRREP